MSSRLDAGAHRAAQARIERLRGVEAAGGRLEAEDAVGDDAGVGRDHPLVGPRVGPAAAADADADRAARAGAAQLGPQDHAADQAARDVPDVAAAARAGAGAAAAAARLALAVR